MRLLYLYQHFTVGGTGAQLRNRLEYLRDRAEVHLGFLEDRGGRSVYGDYPYIHLLGEPSGVERLLRERQFDVVSVIDTPSVYPALAAASYRGVVINEVHTTMMRMDYLWEFYDAPPFDALMGPSEYQRRRMLYEYGFDGLRPVYAVPNCLDVGLFDYRPPRAAPQRKVLLWVGRLDDYKNWPDFLKVAAALRARRDDCAFWLVGGQGAPDGVVLDLLGTLRAQELAEEVTWIQNVDYRAMPRLYALARASGGCHLITSVEESFGMTVAEALACGCPVAATRVGAIPELMDGLHEAGLFELHDVAGAVGVVEALLDDAALRERFAEPGRAKVCERYAPEKAGATYEAALREICARARQRRAEEAGAP